MGTEIGSRDLGDTGRYNQLPVIARQMGLSTASDRTLWKDKAMTELNLAVLHSFSTAGVTISDHHTESVRFLQHLEREERQGRACPADWRSEEHTSELQSRFDLVCRLLLEKKKTIHCSCFFYQKKKKQTT